jgi:hypothetical protein
LQLQTICKWHYSSTTRTFLNASSFSQTLDSSFQTHFTHHGDPNLEQQQHGNGEILFSASHISRRKRSVSNHALNLILLFFSSSEFSICKIKLYDLIFVFWIDVAFWIYCMKLLCLLIANLQELLGVFSIVYYW